jgi:two-component system, NarL family, sensor histidine kinase UhpB
MPRGAEDLALLDALLEHARQSLGADHVTFCAWDEAAATLTIERATGEIDHPEVQATGEPISIGGYGLDFVPYTPGRNEPVIYRDAPDEIAGVREFLRRIGAHSELTIPVFDRPGGKWVLEAFFRDRSLMLGERELATASRLAPLAAAAISRDAILVDLRETEARLRSVVEQIPAITYVDDVDRRPVYTSPQIKSLLGYSQEEWHAPGFWISRVHADDRERVRASYLEVNHTGRIDIEYRMLAGDGRVMWFNERAHLVTDEAGRPAAIHGVIIDITARRLAEEALRESETRRGRVLAEMLRAEEAERARIATELHDDTIQVMTAALITLDRVPPAISAGDDERAIEVLQVVRRTLVTAIERTRRMTFELRPPLLEAHGLQAAVRDLADEAAREGGFHVDLHTTVDRYPFAIEDLVYRTVQEALSNVRKHARASKVAIALHERQGNLTGWVRDDGRGFDLERALDRRRMRMHVGLDAMRERVHLAGGRLEIRSEKANGTSVEFAIPLPAPRSSRG